MGLRDKLQAKARAEVRAAALTACSSQTRRGRLGRAHQVRELPTMAQLPARHTERPATEGKLSAAVERGAADFMPDDGGPSRRDADRCPRLAILDAKVSLLIAAKAPDDTFVASAGTSENGFQRAIGSSARPKQRGGKALAW